MANKKSKCPDCARQGEGLGCWEECITIKSYSWYQRFLNFPKWMIKKEPYYLNFHFDGFTPKDKGEVEKTCGNCGWHGEHEPGDEGRCDYSKRKRGLWWRLDTCKATSSTGNCSWKPLVCEKCGGLGYLGFPQPYRQGVTLCDCTKKEEGLLIDGWKWNKLNNEDRYYLKEYGDIRAEIFKSFDDYWVIKYSRLVKYGIAVRRVVFNDLPTAQTAVEEALKIRKGDVLQDWLTVY